MKTIEKDISIVSNALMEVWEWKDAVYNDIKDKTFEEKQKYYDEGLKEAERLLNGKLIKNPDGSYSLT